MVASIMLMDDPKEFVKRKDMTKYRFEDYDEGYRKQVPRGALSTFVKAHSDMQLSIGPGTSPHYERPHRREEIPESYHHWLEYVWVWVWSCVVEVGVCSPHSSGACTQSVPRVPLRCCCCCCCCCHTRWYSAMADLTMRLVPAMNKLDNDAPGIIRSIAAVVARQCFAHYVEDVERVQYVQCSACVA